MTTGAPRTHQASEASASTEQTSGLLRSSAIMALGTVASRITGFVRTAVLAYALGSGMLAGAFNTANTIPNIIHDLVLGGVMTSVILPMIVRAAKRDPDGGLAYTQRLYTLLVISLVGVTLITMALAGPLAGLYSGSDPHQRHLTLLFSLYFFPQIFFYGINAYQAAILNTRGRFGAPMWTPVINNIICIAVFLAFMVVTHGQSGVPHGNITGNQLHLLGLGTTLALVLQTAAVLPSMRAAGFRWRIRLDFRSLGLSEMGRMAGWTLGYVLATQIGNAVTTRLANTAGAKAVHLGHSGAGYAAYTYAFQIFSLPYAIVAVSIITALLPRMAGHAADGRNDLVRDDFSNGLRVSSVLLVPAAYGMLIFAQPTAVLLFGHVNFSHHDAIMLGRVISAFALGLVPFSMFQLLLRVFYSIKDTRTPALISSATIALGIVINLLAAHLLAPEHVVLGLAVGYWAPYLLGTAIAWRVLGRRLGGLDGRRVMGTVGRLLLAGLPALVFGFAIMLGADQALGDGIASALVTLIVGGGIGGMLYLLFARRFGAEEVATLLSVVRSRLPGRRA